MAITKANADTYFAATNHPRAAAWAGFSSDERTGAIAHAKRIVSRYLNGDLDQDATADGDFPRHDLAVYEQALWSLENSPMLREGREEAPDALATDPEQDDRAREVQAAVLAPEARRWLTRGGAIRLGRA